VAVKASDRHTSSLVLYKSSQELKNGLSNALWVLAFQRCWDLKVQGFRKNSICKCPGNKIALRNFQLKGLSGRSAAREPLI
jgi:hypothetical protein